MQQILSRMKKSSETCQSARNSRRNSATGDSWAPITDFMAKMMMVAPPLSLGPASAVAQAAGGAAQAAGAGAAVAGSAAAGDSATQGAG